MVTQVLFHFRSFSPEILSQFQQNTCPPSRFGSNCVLCAPVSLDSTESAFISANQRLSQVLFERTGALSFNRLDRGASRTGDSPEIFYAS